MDRHRVAAVGLALLGGTVVVFTAYELFPFHSLNHDEAVYLQQAGMLLEGQLRLRPPVPGAMRPWFFVRDGSALYPKYSPVPAAVFALGQALVGSYRVALGGIVTVSILLTYGLVEEVIDARHGIAAAATLAVSPLFLIDSSVFLPYAVTFAFELGFALAYVRTIRTRHPGYGALAGGAIGVAFFARPYTAVLFALPFLLHALWWLGRGSAAFSRLRPLVPTALVGVGFVGLTLAYNAVMTGNPVRFPYEAFAPRDGLGFGRRAILGYERVYTPEIAVRAAIENVAVYAGRWIPAGPIGTLVGLYGIVRCWKSPLARLPTDDPERIQIVIAGIVPSVIVGEAYFWGQLNVLGDPEVGGDGLIAVLGPYYHFDLLLPTAMFVAIGGLALWDRWRAWIVDRVPERQTAFTIAAALLVLSGTLVLTVAVAGPVVARNAQVTDAYESAYRPVIEREFDDAVVLLPTPYGDWLNHPFQVFRNDPGFSSDVVYAIRDEATWELADRYPERTFYRYGYRGRWYPPEGRVTPVLQRMNRARGDRLVLTVTFGIPQTVDRTSVRVSSGNEVAYYVADNEGSRGTLRLFIRPGNASLGGSGVRSVSDDPLTVSGKTDIDMEVFLTTGAGGFSYGLSVPVRMSDGQVEALTPALEVCREPRLCDGEAAHVPGAHRHDVWIETSLSSA